MAREQKVGVCDDCSETFRYDLIHNGFNDSAYSYCDSCGRTVLLNRFSSMSVSPNLKVHQRLWDGELERLLRPCPCGGKFRADASPRCPIAANLSPFMAKRYREGNASGTKKGWIWQDNWSGIYAIVIEGKVVEDWWESAQS